MKRAIVLVAAMALALAACGLKVPVTIVAGSETENNGLTTAPTEGPKSDAGSETGTGAVGDGRPGGDATTTTGGVDPGVVGKLFDNETEGITNQQITMCTHVPITGAAPIPHHPDRFGQFYFNYVNDELKGVYNRKIRFLAYNDQYNPAGARDAVEKCSRNGAFMYLGAAGTDQIVSVARWAERKRVPYFHGPTSDKDLGGLTYNIFGGPTYEYQSKLLARYLIKRFGKDLNYGVIRVNSPYFDAGAEAFKKELTRLGGKIRADLKVQKDEKYFQNVFFSLESNNVKVINNFTTPNIWLTMLNQKKATYNPWWTAVSPVAGFNIVAAALKNSKALVFHHFNPACECTTYKDEEISQHKDLPWYSDIQEFLRIFKKYSPQQDPPPDDFDYGAYLTAKAVHRILLKLGPQPTRSKLWALLTTYKESPQKTFPGCSTDFTRNKARMGSWFVNIFELVSSKGVWKQVETCVDETHRSVKV